MKPVIEFIVRANSCAFGGTWLRGGEISLQALDILPVRKHEASVYGGLLPVLCQLLVELFIPSRNFQCTPTV